MKWNISQAKNVLKQPNTALPALILTHGDDGGTAQRLVREFTAHTGVAKDDPFLFTAVTMPELLENQGKLLEAVTTIGFGGGKRLVVLEGITPAMGAAATNAVTSAVKACLEIALEDVIVLIPAHGITPTSALVKAVEKAPNAAAIRCFQANARDITTHVQETVQKAGKTIEPSAVAWITETLGLDSEITQNELEKLLLYVGEEKNITLADCLAVIAGAPAVNVFALCDAVGLRDTQKVDKTLQTLLESGEDLYGAFSLVVRHLRRMLQVQETVASGQAESNALRSLTPPVNFGQDVFLRQVRTYPPRRLATVTARALEAQKQSRQGFLPPDLVLARAVLSFAV